MSHEVETFAGHGAAWHGLGVNVDHEMTAEECFALAGLDWEVEKRPMEVLIGETVEQMQRYVQVPDKQAVLRTSDNTVLGVVGNRYECIQNSECFNFIDTIVGDGLAMYHTAGSLFNGKIVFITLKFPENVMVGNDIVEKYLLLTNAHDGSSALHGRMTPTRVVCANTLGMALSKNTTHKVSIRHTKNWEVKAKEARELLKLTDFYYKNMSESFNRLLDTSFNDDQILDFVSKVFPKTKSEKTGEPILSTQTKKIRKQVVDLAYNGKGQADIKNTKWAAFNGVTEYIDHYATTRATGDRNADEVKMNSVLLGTGAEVKQRAYNILVEA